MSRSSNRPDPKAYYPITWDSCFLIYEIEHDADDFVRFALKTGDKISKMRKSRVRFTSHGDAYFRAGSGYTRIYFGDCLRMK